MGVAPLPEPARTIAGDSLRRAAGFTEISLPGVHIFGTSATEMVQHRAGRWMRGSASVPGRRGVQLPDLLEERRTDDERCAHLVLLLRVPSGCESAPAPKQACQHLPPPTNGRRRTWPRALALCSTAAARAGCSTIAVR